MLGNVPIGVSFFESYAFRQVQMDVPTFRVTLTLQIFSCFGVKVLSFEVEFRAASSKISLSNSGQANVAHTERLRLSLRSPRCLKSNVKSKQVSTVKTKDKVDSFRSADSFA